MWQMQMSSLSKTSIKEANEHLQQLHQKIYELENQLQLHALDIEDLQRSNLDLQRKLSDVTTEKEKLAKQKDEEIAELYRQLEEKEKQLQKLLANAEEKDDALIKLETRSRLFYEIAEHRTSLARILQVFEEVGTELGDNNILVSNSPIRNSYKLSNEKQRVVKPDKTPNGIEPTNSS